MVIEEKKEDPAASLAAEEKIAGYTHPEALISVYELNRQIDNVDTVTFDTRGRSYQVFQQSYPNGHIPGAIPILHDQYCNHSYSDRIAPPPQLQDLLGECGVGEDTQIILYGNDGLQTRVYWAVKMYGYDRVKILDGGLDKWKEAGFDISSVYSRRRPDTFEFDLTGSKAEQMLATMIEVEGAIGDGSRIIVDARSRDEYLSGHIPGSVNLSSTELFNKDKTFKKATDLRELVESKKITRDKKIIVYCDYGIRSSLVWFALSELLGYPDVKNYDGSYNEWVKNKKSVVYNE